MADGIDAAYEGREQTFIKHQFLTRYLRDAAYKTLQGRSPIFNFVDAFAGPWQIEDDEDYSDASFNQALRTLIAVRDDLKQRGLVGLKVRFCFCEKRPDAAARLRDYAKRHTDFQIHVFEGEFERNLQAVDAAIPDGFTFTFIDPTGWNIRNEEIFAFLTRQNGEFLLNFMSDHINRHSGYDAVAASFGRFLADPDWAQAFVELPDGLPNEVKILRLLKRRMKEAKVAKFLPDFSIMLPRQERVKMRLVLGTNVRQGLELFRDVQDKVERQEMEIRQAIREGSTRQASLFSVADHVDFEKERKGVGCRRYVDLAESRILEVLQGCDELKYDPLLVHLMEYVPIRRPQVNKLVGEMRKRRQIDYQLPSGKRVPQSATRIWLPDREETEVIEQE